MDWLITFGLMGLIIMAGALNSAIHSGLLHANATEPFKSQQLLDMSLALGLASVVPFWRNHLIVGSITLALAGWFAVEGAWGLWRHGRSTKAST